MPECAFLQLHGNIDQAARSTLANGPSEGLAPPRLPLSETGVKLESMAALMSS